MFPAAAGDIERPCVFVCPKPKPTPLPFADSAADEGEADAEAEAAAVSLERLRGDEAATGENVKDTAATQHDHLEKHTDTTQQHSKSVSVSPAVCPCCVCVCVCPSVPAPAPSADSLRGVLPLSAAAFVLSVAFRRPPSDNDRKSPLRNVLCMSIRTAQIKQQQATAKQ